MTNHITVSTHCDAVMGRLYCLSNYMMSQWVSDIAIETIQSRDQELESFTKNLDLYTRSMSLENVDISPQKVNLALHDRILLFSSPLSLP